MSVRFDTILLPTDFSELAAAALPYARHLAESFRAQLHSLHVVDEAYQYWNTMGPESMPIGPPPEEFLAIGRARMEKFAAECLGGLNRPAVTAVLLGRPFSEIVNYAKTQSVNLIVMGTHGRGAIAHMLLGSTTEKVLRKAPCPVLTVRSGEHRFESS